MLLVVTELFAKFTSTVSCILRTMLFMQLIFYVGKFMCKPNSRKTSVIFIAFHPASMMFSPVALQLRAPPKVSARAPAHRSYHFRGVKLKSCIKKIHHNLYISKQANVRIKHADTEGASHKKFGTNARVQ